MNASRVLPLVIGGPMWLNDESGLFEKEAKNENYVRK